MPLPVSVHVKATGLALPVQVRTKIAHAIIVHPFKCLFIETFVKRNPCISVVDDLCHSECGLTCVNGELNNQTCQCSCQEPWQGSTCNGKYRIIDAIYHFIISPVLHFLTNLSYEINSSNLCDVFS